MDYKNSKSRQQGFSYIGKYKIVQFLGKGGTAKVKLAEDSLTGKKVALKIFRDPTESKMKIKHSLQQVTQEFKVIENLKHINILNVMEILENTYYERKNGQKYLTTTIVLEYAEGGECFDYVAQFQNFSEKVARTYFHQLLKGIQFLHENGICHRDIKMENLLFDDEFNLKIADFGFARDIEGQNGDGKLFSRLGTEGYQAAEIKEQKNYSGEKVDIFACGVVLFLFIAGRPPFEAAATNNRWYRTFQERKLDFWKFQNKYSNFPPQLCRLLDKMMHHYPERRANLEYIWANDWVKGPTLSKSELKKEMSEKLVQLQKKQEQERQKKKLQKQKMQEEINQKRQKEQYQYEPPVEGKVGVVKIFRSADLYSEGFNNKINEHFRQFSNNWFFDQSQEDIDSTLVEFSQNVKPIKYMSKFNLNQYVMSPQLTLKALLPILDKNIKCLNISVQKEKALVIVDFEQKNLKDTSQLKIKFRKNQIEADDEGETILQFEWQNQNLNYAKVQAKIINEVQNISNQI